MECPLFNTAEEYCLKRGSEPTLPIGRKHKLRGQFATCVVEQSVDQPDSTSSQNDFRQHVHLPVLNCVISELVNRFSQEPSQ